MNIFSGQKGGGKKQKRKFLRDSRTDAPINDLTAAIRSIRPFRNMGLFGV
jgi:hypothetical protein